MCRIIAVSQGLCYIDRMQKKPGERPLKWVVGIDEVGRGPIAGPVTLCAVAMAYSEYEKTRWRGLTDSKQLTAKQREVWAKKAWDMEQLGVLRIAIASQTAATIDRKGISACIKMCITAILAELDLDPTETIVLLDGGLKAPAHYIHQQTIIKGDAKEKIISLASVVAKVSRDAYMTKIASKYPGYDWDKNKGYGTQKHVQSLKKRGFTGLHRKSFLGRMLDI
jgi:ribonuclease HII